MKIKEQIKLFFKYFNSIENNTNTKFPNSQIQSLNFNREFYNALIKDNYLSADDTTFKGYDFIIEDDEDADYWGFFMKQDLKK